MKKAIIILFLIGIVINSYGQRRVDANEVIVRDSINLNGEWLIISGATNGESFVRTNGRWVNGEIGITQPVDSLLYKTFIDNPSWYEGNTFYDSTKHALSYFNDEADVTINLGQELVFRVLNNTGSTISNGAVVSSGSGGTQLADARYKNSSDFVGLATHDIETGTYGYVTRLGDVGGLNTSAYSVGDKLYLGESGSYSTTRPTDGSYSVLIGVVVKVGTTDGIIRVNPRTSDTTVEITDTNGFPYDQLDSCSISFNESTLYYKIEPTVSSYHYYVDGDKFEKTTADSVQISDQSGLHAFYFDDDTLRTVFNPNAGQVDNVIRTKAIIGYVYWNTVDDSMYYHGDERHGILMSTSTHSYLHFSFGAQYLNGLGLTSITAGGVSTVDSTAQFGIASGTITDEDLPHFIGAVADTIGFPIYYKTGTDGSEVWQRYFEDGFAVTNNGSVSGRLMFNELSGGTWQLSEVGSNGDYILCHIYATNGIEFEVIAVMGEDEYGTLAAARSGADTELLNLSINGLPAEEFKPVATIIFQTSAVYSNTVNAIIVSTADGDDYIDWRYTNFAGSGGTSTTPTSWVSLTDTPNSLSGTSGYFSQSNGTSIELNAPGDIELTGFDSTGFQLTQSQIIDLQDSLDLRLYKTDFADSLSGTLLTTFDSTGFRLAQDQVTDLPDSLLAKQNLITGAASSVVTSNLTASSAMVTNATGKISVLDTVSAAEVGWLNGVTSSIQDQIDAVSAYDLQDVTDNDTTTTHGASFGNDVDIDGNLSADSITTDYFTTVKSDYVNPSNMTNGYVPYKYNLAGIIQYFDDSPIYTASGNVAIGYTTTTYKLNVNGAIGAVGGIYSGGLISGTSIDLESTLPNIKFKDTNTSNLNYRSWVYNGYYHFTQEDDDFDEDSTRYIWSVYPNLDVYHYTTNIFDTTAVFNDTIYFGSNGYWLGDTYGAKFTGNAGFGAASSQNTKVYVIGTGTSAISAVNTNASDAIYSGIFQVTQSGGASAAVYGNITSSAGGLGSAAVRGDNSSTTSSEHYGGYFTAYGGSLGYGVAARGGEADLYAYSTGRVDVAESSDLGTPQSGDGRYGGKTDGFPYYVNDAGYEFQLARVDTTQDLTETSGAVSWNYAAGSSAIVTIDETTVITITNMPEGAEGTIRIVQGDSGDDNVTFVLSGKTVEWRGDDSDLTDASGGVDYISLKVVGDYLGVTLGSNYTAQ